ncbi:MAG: two-component sensor [marine bacterium B5-7]|nr:MAG: two-component sensor [marine bacterium B5-7]
MKSLKARLGSGLIIALLLVFTLQWLVVSIAIKHVTENYVASHIQHDIDVLLANINFDEENIASLLREPEGRFNDGPFTGQYYQVYSTHTTLRSRSLWDQSLIVDPISTGDTLQKIIEGPLKQPLLAISKGFKKQGNDITITVAEDLSVVNKGIESMQHLYLLLSLGLLLLLLLSQQWIVSRSLKSLTSTRLNLERVSRGETDRLSESVPTEVLPLVQEINLLLGLLSRRLQKTRSAVGNLAHALKTPLSLLLNTKEDPIIKNETELLNTLDKQIESIQVTLERELNRARLSGDAKSGQRFKPKTELPALIETLQQIHKQRHLDIELTIPDQSNWNADHEDMMELFGNLADNACKWATKRVRITLEKSSGHFIIEDDGPGCPTDQLELLSHRGLRLDESISGHGLGLSIVNEIIHHYEGQIIFDESTFLGGLKVTVQLFKTNNEIKKQE